MTVIDCCNDENEGKQSMDVIWKHINEETVRLRALIFNGKNKLQSFTSTGENKEN